MRPSLICVCSEVTRITAQCLRHAHVWFCSACQGPKASSQIIQEVPFAQPPADPASAVWHWAEFGSRLDINLLCKLCHSWVVSINLLNKNGWCQRRSFAEKLEKGIHRERNYPLENATESQNCVVEWNTNLCVYTWCVFILQLSSL